MTSANPGVEYAPLLSIGPPQPNTRPQSGLKRIFVGPHGLRAAWPLLIFLAIIGVPAAGLFLISCAAAVRRGIAAVKLGPDNGQTGTNACRVGRLLPLNAQQ